LTEYGVPDDDMSDSLPPVGGPSSYDEWDRHGLLSGKHVRVTEGMRPLASTLAALRAAPMPAELAGEATARMMFRQIMTASASGQAGSGGGRASTLGRSAPAADAGPRPVARPRHSHRRPRRRRWQFGGEHGKLAVAGAAAAVVIVGAAAVGAFAATGGQSGQTGHSTGTTSTPARSGGGTELNGLDGTGKEATAHPTPSASPSQQPASGPGTGASPGALCRQYWEFFTHPESRAAVAAASDNFEQLSNLAGGPDNIGYYCLRLQPWSVPSGPGFPGEPGLPPPGGSQGLPGQQGSPGQQGKNRPGPAQHAGNQNGADNGNGKGGNSPGFGSQQQK
jgi:hypothetical protein